jgi:GTP pyrophosphokinase
MDIKELEQFINYKPIFSEQELVPLVEDIKQKASEYLPKDQIKQIDKAFQFAKKAHQGQKRLSGEPYIVHPVRATQFLMKIKPDIASIQACLLHDVIEDTPYTYEDIKENFGEEVANLCEGLVKVSKVRYKHISDKKEA